MLHKNNLLPHMISSLIKHLEMGLIATGVLLYPTCGGLCPSPRHFPTTSRAGSNPQTRRAFSVTLALKQPSKSSTYTLKLNLAAAPRATSHVGGEEVTLAIKQHKSELDRFIRSLNRTIEDNFLYTMHTRQISSHYSEPQSRDSEWAPKLSRPSLPRGKL